MRSPFLFSVRKVCEILLTGRIQHRFEFVRGLLLHRGKNVAVGIQRDLYA
jgi:hypothetical protein